MKGIVAIFILILFIFPGCSIFILFDKHYQVPKFSYNNIMITSKIDGIILYTGFQVNQYLKIDIDLLSHDFLSVLSVKTKDNLKVRSYTGKQKKDFNEFINNEGYTTITTTVSTDQVLVAEDHNLLDDQVFILKRNLEFLNKNNECNYYFSVLADVTHGNLLRSGKPVEPIMYINIYNRDGRKIYCNKYSKIYSETDKFSEKEWQERIVFYFKRLIIDCKDDINKDLDSVISH